jgi:hypothetical protein
VGQGDKMTACFRSAFESSTSAHEHRPRNRCTAALPMIRLPSPNAACRRPRRRNRNGEYDELPAAPALAEVCFSGFPINQCRPLRLLT